MRLDLATIRALGLEPALTRLARFVVDHYDETAAAWTAYVTGGIDAAEKAANHEETP